MTSQSQYTLDQVAAMLNLSEAVVRRLSQYFRMPINYYATPPGQPRLLLYRSDEVQVLSRVQQWLVEGKNLQEIKRILQPHLYGHLLKQGQKNQDSRDERLLEGQSLVEYADNDELRQRMAEATFNQYRQNNLAQQAPLMQLAQAVQGMAQAEDSAPHRSMAHPFNPLARQSNKEVMPFNPFPSMSPSNDWLKPR